MAVYCSQLVSQFLYTMDTMIICLLMSVGVANKVIHLVQKAPPTPNAGIVVFCYHGVTIEIIQMVLIPVLHPPQVQLQV